MRYEYFRARFGSESSAYRVKKLTTITMVNVDRNSQISKF